MAGGEVDPLIAAIARLGFSELEAAAYHALLRAPASTGYRVAKMLGKPHANVYQALTSLERKGAVIFEDDTSRLYSAVAPSEVFGLLRRTFDAESTAVEQALESLGVAKQQQQDRLFRLATRDQVFTRARTLIDDAAECILFYGAPAEAQVLRPLLEAAVARGVCVTGIMVRAADIIPGSKLHLSRVADELSDRWGNLPLMLGADARELLIAELVPESQDVRDAIWTGNRLLSALFHNCIVSDIVLHSLPEIEVIRSPNSYLLGEVPQALKALFSDRSQVHAFE